MVRVLHGTASGFDRADEHGVVTALRADVVHCFVLSFAFAGADDRDVPTANACVLLTDGHQLDVRVILRHMLDHDVFALTAGHRDRVTRLQGFGLGLSRDVVHVCHMSVLVCIVLFVCGVGRTGPPHHECNGECESGSEADCANEAGFLGHEWLLSFLVHGYKRSNVVLERYIASVLLLVSPFLVDCVLEESCDIDKPVHRAEFVRHAFGTALKFVLATRFAAPLPIDDELEFVVPVRQRQRASPMPVRLSPQRRRIGTPIVERAGYEHGLRLGCVAAEFDLF